MRLCLKGADMSETVCVSASDMISYLTEWRDMNEIDFQLSMILAWLPMIESIEVDCGKNENKLKIMFYGHGTDPWGKLNVGATVELRDTGIERLLFNIVVGNKIVGKSAFKESQDSVTLDKELIVLEGSNGFFTGYIRKNESSDYEQVFITKAPGLFYDIKRYADKGYNKLTMLDITCESDFLKGERNENISNKRHV